MYRIIPNFYYCFYTASDGYAMLDSDAYGGATDGTEIGKTAG